MTEIEQKGTKGPNWTTIALIAGLLLLLLLFAYFATNRNADQDKLTQADMNAVAAGDPEKLCAGKATYDLIKRDLFRRAAQVRGSDQAAYDKLAAYAVVRMENPVMESQDSNTGAVNCSGSLSLDLPPGVAVVGGRRTLTSDVDYSMQQAADGSGAVVLLRNADAIITPLATLARGNQPVADAVTDDTDVEDPLAPLDDQQEQAAPEAPAVPVAPPAPSRPTAARPSFNCANAKTKGEIAVCGDAGLAALDRNMAAQYGRAAAAATPEQARLLRQTRDRFLGYRDRCPNKACISDAYNGRMREIRDIMEGRWSPR
ncbi:MAG: hypothetical protein V4513_10035 [Pseudomonadota bacterium]